MSTEQAEIVLRSESLAKHFLSGQQRIDVLRSINFEVHAGETISIRGASGSGKSTLLNLLAGIEKADEGRVFWGEDSIESIPEDRQPRLRARQIGFIFQFFHLVQELNALENVMLAGRILGRPVKTCRVEAEGFLELLGMKDRQKGLTQHLSGGERQRVAIARALMNRPIVILADEPTGNLDESTAGQVMESLLASVEEVKTALVLVTHHAGFAQSTDRQYKLEGGILSSIPEDSGIQA